MADSYFVYMMASRRNGTLYVGATNDLLRRAYEHKAGAVPGFTAEHGLGLLVWYEAHVSIEAAILQERRLKRWRRKWKLELIEKMNPDWRDHFDELGPS